MEMEIAHSCVVVLGYGVWFHTCTWKWNIAYGNGNVIKFPHRIWKWKWKWMTELIHFHFHQMEMEMEMEIIPLFKMEMEMEMDFEIVPS